MRIIITKDVGKWSAFYIKEKIKEFQKRNNHLVLGLPTGGTAVGLYKSLVDFYNKKEISFQDVITFNMDEYIGLPREHKESYWSFMHNNLFNNIDIKAENINLPDGNAKDIKKECLEYEEKIEKIGGIDLFVGGVGENGHIAFNEPYSSLSARTRDKELDEDTILANSRFFNNDINLVPKSAITVGVGTLQDAKEVLIMITGAKKAKALAKGVEGPISHKWPISALQLHQKALLVIDEEAANDLKVKTYKYFKDLKDEYSYIEDSI